MPTARDYITRLASTGQHHFTTEEATDALGVSSVATRAALRHLAHRGEIAMPSRSFWVIVPPEYRRLGCLPAEQFVPQFLAQLRLPYYVGLLSAAQYHGAAHHKPQEFQVIVENNRRPIECGAVRVLFVARRGVAQVPTTTVNTPRGFVRLSTPEATAIDLVGYPGHAGGLDQIATVLSELAERIDPTRLVEVAKISPLTWAQRLGYLLDTVGAQERTEPLAAYIRERHTVVVPLSPSDSQGPGKRNERWRLEVNVRVEAEV